MGKSPRTHWNWAQEPFLGMNTLNHLLQMTNHCRTETQAQEILPSSRARAPNLIVQNWEQTFDQIKVQEIKC